MPATKQKTDFRGRETFNKNGWWTARDDDGKVRKFKWDYRWQQCPTVNHNGMTGEATEYPTTPRRIHICAKEECPCRHPGSKRGAYGPCQHVRFIGFVATETACEGDAISPGGASSGGAVVVPSSLMGGGTAGASPTVATDMPSSVPEVPGEELHVAASPPECGGGGGIMWPPR